MPGYWMHETSGVLRPAVVAYLNHRPMTNADIAAMRAYLRQWMEGPWEDAGDLFVRIDEIKDSASLTRWLDDALDLGIDPL